MWVSFLDRFFEWWYSLFIKLEDSKMEVLLMFKGFFLLGGELKFF